MPTTVNVDFDANTSSFQNAKTEEAQEFRALKIVARMYKAMAILSMVGGILVSLFLFFSGISLALRANAGVLASLQTLLHGVAAMLYTLVVSIFAWFCLQEIFLLPQLEKNSRYTGRMHVNKL